MYSKTELLNQLLDQRESAISEARGLADLADDSREDDWQRTQRDIDNLGQRIADARLDVQNEEESREFAEALAGTGYGRTNKNMANIQSEVRYGTAFAQGQSFNDFSHDKAASVEEAGAFVHAVLRGSEAEARIAMNEGTGSQGGYLVPIAYVSTVLALAQAATVLDKVGTQFVPLKSSTVRMAKSESSPVFAARSENGAYADADCGFGLVEWVPRSVGGILKFSESWAEDSETNIDEFLATTLSQAAAQAMDTIGVWGSGIAPNPRGLRNVVGLSVTPIAANGGPVTDFGPIIQNVARIKAANYVPTGSIIAPRLEASLANLRGTDGQYLSAPAYLAQVPSYVTSNSPVNLAVGTSGNVTTEVISGDFRQLFCGVRHELRLRPLNELYLATGQRGLVFDMRLDFQVARIGAFSVLSGVTS